MELKDKNILVVGLARTGVAVVQFLAGRGARVTVTDMKGDAELAPCLDALAGIPVTYQLGRHDDRTFLDADLIVVSPGVPMDIPPLALARGTGRRIISEVELAAAFITAPLVGITGTNGKTTTTTLTGEIFAASGLRTFVGGNIGNPLIELVASGEEVDRAVVELSSFQLEGIERFQPKVAVLLNITEDHLDRYASYQEYIDAKARIFMNQTADDFAVLTMDDPLVASFAGRVAARVIPTSQQRELAEGVFCTADDIVCRLGGNEMRFSLAACGLKGSHNRENMMAAVAATLLLGASEDAVRRTLAGFRGLPHRMEFVRELRGVSYYEDSKATNVGSVVKSLESFAGAITLIAGGKDKGGDYAPLAGLVRDRVSHLILIGEARERINAALGSLTDTHLVGSLEEAVTLAHRLTGTGGTVLFSPACSSFDMFKDYAERARRFVELVHALEGGSDR
jgi:UDP-N-acetylmuramoylalanine--D-glutamate ligase